MALFRRKALAFVLATSGSAFCLAAAAQTPATGGSWRGGSAPDTPIRTTSLPPSAAASGLEIADRYLERVRSDRENADLWVYCAAAVLKRSSAGDAAADAYARDIAATMKATLDGADASPCEDAIPAETWNSVQPSAMSGSSASEGPAIGRPAAPDAIVAPDPGALTVAEEERLRRANAAADAQERARVAAQAAAEQRRTNVQGRYERERAQYEADVAAARAADATYQRQLEDRRRTLESGQYREPR